MNLARPMLLLFALVPYALVVVAFGLFALYAWHAWAAEPVAVPIPTPVPAAPSVGSEVANYATGGGAVGGLAVLMKLAHAVGKFFGDIREHFKAEETALREQTAALKAQTEAIKEQTAKVIRIVDYLDEVELIDKVARREGVTRGDTDRIALGVQR